uniref:Uncharacterized protein n=1 Tax=Aegilops tauschii TaxID=37682 RepID=R7WDS9_AEGTA
MLASGGGVAVRSGAEQTRVREERPCSLHKERKQEVQAAGSKPVSAPSSPPVGSGCSRRQVRALPQLVPVGSGHWARRALAPSPAAQQSQHRKRAEGFRAGPSRLSAASMAGGRAGTYQ